MPNRLANETSPYLQQHADNPVDWYPWGEEALRLAREQDQPILLSIGYSACHWCHVMAHESFADPEVAAVMNDLFVNIKVDREERPDLDQIYQAAPAMLTQKSGGWPLTMFLMPDQTPFFGGTYFPRESRYGLAGFRDLLPRIAEAYHKQRDAIARQNEAVREALARSVELPARAPAFAAAPLDNCVLQFSRMFDDVHGGLGGAPKFPHPFELDFCLRRFAAARDEHALEMVKLTLARMAEGGIFDQLGGGFCRYSVDQYWTIPHFEKMLYDNGPLLRLYSDLWLVDPQPLFARVAADTAAWVMREMQSPDGGYYSSLDADSEHEEGKYYVWTPDQVQAALSAEEHKVIVPHYGLDTAPNFEGSHWHLRVTQPLVVVAKQLGMPIDRAQALLDAARAKLFALRERRVRPGRDEKILVSWNALMIGGMARAARVFDRPDWVRSARAAADFIHGNMWRDQRLLATCKDGRAHLNAYLDDYAFLLAALLELMQGEFRAGDLEWARAIADVLLEQFEDPVHGGFFFVSHDHEQLIHRPKTGHDNATPSGNGIAAAALIRLGHLLGEPRYLAAAERALQAFYPALEHQPGAHASLCVALEEHLTPPTIVVIRGATGVEAWQRELGRYYLPSTLALAIPSGITDLPATLDRPHGADTVNAWVCRGVTCLPPTVDLARLVEILARAPA